MPPLSPIVFSVPAIHEEDAVVALQSKGKKQFAAPPASGSVNVGLHDIGKSGPGKKSSQKQPPKEIDTSTDPVIGSHDSSRTAPPPLHFTPAVTVDMTNDPPAKPPHDGMTAVTVDGGEPHTVQQQQESLVDSAVPPLASKMLPLTCAMLVIRWGRLATPEQ